MISRNSVLTKKCATPFSARLVHHGYVNDLVGQTTTHFAQWDFDVIGCCWLFPCASEESSHKICQNIPLKFPLGK